MVGGGDAAASSGTGFIWGGARQNDIPPWWDMIAGRVVNDDQVLTTSLELADMMAPRPRPAFGEAKRLILSGATESLESQMEKESRAMTAMAGRVDGREGIAAFMGKRTLKFTGQQGPQRSAGEPKRRQGLAGNR
jgi:hypothetical protein